MTALSAHTGTSPSRNRLSCLPDAHHSNTTGHLQLRQQNMLALRHSRAFIGAGRCSSTAAVVALVQRCVTRAGGRGNGGSTDNSTWTPQHTGTRAGQAEAPGQRWG